MRDERLGAGQVRLGAGCLGTGLDEPGLGREACRPLG